MANENDIQGKEEQLKKDKIKQEQSMESHKLRCRICLKEIAPVRRCFGHGAGGGSDGSGSSKGEAHKGDGTTAKDITQAITNENFKQEFQLDEINFNPEIISELLSKGLLKIDNDRELGILTIQCNPNLLTPVQNKEVTKFVNAILKELVEFKKEKGISANCAKIDRDDKGNIRSLRITLPTPTIYDDFIKRLASKKLLPIQNIKQQEKGKLVYPEGMNHFNRTPLSTKQAPITKKTEELQNIRPRYTSHKPLLKPKV